MIKKLSFLFVLVFLCSPLFAVSISYYSEADYLNALGSASTTTYDFNALTPGSIIASGDVLNGATFDYALSGVSIVVDNTFATTSDFNYLGTNDGSGAFVGGDSFTMNFDQTMRSVGLYVISADLIFDNDFTITTNSGQSVSNISMADVTLLDGDAYYLSLVEDDFSLGFDSITLSSINQGFLFNVDDITVSAVPLPAAIWLMSSGVLLLIAASRRK